MRYKALILNDYPGEANYATKVYQGTKTIETRMGRLFSHRGDVVICKGKTNSVGDNRGMALCMVTIFHGRKMTKADEAAACIEWHPKRAALLLSNWRYFNRLFEFAPCTVGGTYQGIFEIELPTDIKLIPQPQIIGYQGASPIPRNLFDDFIIT